MHLSKVSTLLLAALLVSAAQAKTVSQDANFGQPAAERQAQRTLPQSQAGLWTLLRQTKIGEDDKRGMFTAAFPAAVKALNGETVKISGFMMPLDTSDKSKHFLLSKYTPVCFFCPPGQPNEVVEVTSTKGVAITSRMVTVDGKMALINDGEKGLFFRIDGATVQ